MPFPRLKLRPISTDNRARCTGTLIDEVLPDNIDNKKYITVPDKRKLDLGKPLVLDFVS